jgi:hypothetical protein
MAIKSPQEPSGRRTPPVSYTIAISGGIAQVYPELEPHEQRAIDQIFRDPGSTKAALKGLANGMGGLPILKDMADVREPVAVGVELLMRNFMGALDGMEAGEIESLRLLLSDRDKATKALKKMVAGAKTL